MGVLLPHSASTLLLLLFPFCRAAGLCPCRLPPVRWFWSLGRASETIRKPSQPPVLGFSCEKRTLAFFLASWHLYLEKCQLYRSVRRKTSYPMGIVMVRYFLFQPALQLELKGGASSLPGKCTSPVTRGGRAGGSHTVGLTTGGAQWQRVACPSAQFWGVVYLVVPQRSALTLSFISPDDSGSCLISF